MESLHGGGTSLLSQSHTSLFCSLPPEGRASRPLPCSQGSQSPSPELERPDFLHPYAQLHSLFRSASLPHTASLGLLPELQG